MGMTAKVTRWADGNSVVISSHKIELEPRSAPWLLLTMQRSTGLHSAGCSSVADCFLTTSLTSGTNGDPLAPDNQQWLTLWRNAKLQKAVLKIDAKASGSTGEVAITVISNNVAPAVMVHCAEPTDFGWFSDNAMLVMPGQPINLKYTPRS